jgi:anti-sigma-K factor RskA
MNYNKPDLISALSAEYVLGTLRGKARDRFDRLKFSNQNIQDEVAYWESQLNQMSLQVNAVQPELVVWENIHKRIGFNDSTIIDQPEPASEMPNIQAIEVKQNTTWKWVSGVATAASLVLAILLTVNYNSLIDEPVQSVAVISNEDAVPLWSFDVLPEHIDVKTTNAVPTMANNDYQLWIVPASGEAPISIGVMKQVGSYKLAKPAQYDQIVIAAIAVSKEPLGGSPTGAPTEVLYATKLAIL